MTILRYVLRSLQYRRRAAAAVLAGVITGSAVLTGALLVGDSMRGSLRERALSRLGDAECALVCPRFFGPSVQRGAREALERALFRHMEEQLPPGSHLPEMAIAVTVPSALVVTGSATHAETHARSNGVQIIGFDDEFWMLAQDRDILYSARRPPGAGPFQPLTGDDCLINSALADELNLQPGEELVLMLARPSDVPLESLLGRRDETLATVRLKAAAVLEDQDVAALSLRPQRAAPRNLFLPLNRLQALLKREGLVNTMFVARRDVLEIPPVRIEAALISGLRQGMTLPDLGLHLRIDEVRGSVALESGALLISPAAESAASRALEKIGAGAVSVFAYLANDIETTDGRSVPYSIVAGLDAPPQWWAEARDVDGEALNALGPDDILLNAWTAEQLGAQVGDEVKLRFFVSRGVGALETQDARFRVAAVLPMQGPLLDSGWAPTYPGITDARRLSDWDPPFPFDFKKIREADEDYWDQHHATPKAFVNLNRAQSLWADQPQRHGRLTAIRLIPGSAQPPDDWAKRFEREFLAGVDPADFGFRVEPVRRRALEASQGTTDFSGLFMGFSLFLIASAVMLVALLFRLGVEQRSREIGLLSAVGFSAPRIRRMLLTEGAMLAAAGSLLGLPVALAYAWLMIAGLRTWWSAAVHAPFLTVHAETTSLWLGVIASTGVALVGMALGLRGVMKRSSRALLSGATADGAEKPARSAVAGRRGASAAVLTIVAAVFAWFTRTSPHAASVFFIVGVLALVSGLMIIAARWRAQARMTLRPGRAAWLRMGFGNAPRHRGRSLLTVALIASATFLVTALQVFRLSAGSDEPGLTANRNDAGEHAPTAIAVRGTGTGGFALLAEASSPLPYDLSTPQGRRDLNLSEESVAVMAKCSLFPFRRQSGDEASCQGLYAPSRPRILGADAKFIAWGGFAFSAAMEDRATAGGTPWNLLDVKFEDGALPAIGDEASVRWQLHSGLGRDLTIENEAGREARLRFVALLKGSALQSELIVSESSFVRLFPSTSGHSFFLIEAPNGSAEDIGRLLETDLARFGFDVSPVRRRMEGYFAVQNTYIATFQVLGGFGLVLGSLGLAVVLMRTLLERRSELALMQALGFSRWAIRWMVMAESTSLVVAGLAIGVIAAALAVAPHALSSASEAAFSPVAALVAGVLATTLATNAWALRSALRAPLVAALRRE